MTDERRSRIAIVTGASRGLGREVALALAAQGHPIVLVARQLEPLAEAAALIEQCGGSATAVAADVSDERSVERLAADVRALPGTPSILVNAAGIFGPIQTVIDSDPRRWIETIAVNLFGPYLTCHAFAGAMAASGWGRIVNFSSAAALHSPGPLNSAYATSKVALNQFTRQLAAELAGSGVTANVIHPGEVKTEMWAEIQQQANSLGPQAGGYRQWVEWVQQTGGDDPKKAADLVLRIVSDESATLSGQFLWIEEGLQPPIPSWPAP